VLSYKVIRKRLAKVGRNKSVGPDGFPGKILKLGRDAMLPYLARLLEKSLNNATISIDLKKAFTELFTKGVTDQQSQIIDPSAWPSSNWNTL
jgi:hypothetical protein